MQSVLAQCTIEDFELVKDLICTKSGFFGSVWDTFNGVRTDLVEQLFEQYKAERSPEKKQQRNRSINPTLPTMISAL